MIDFYIGMVFTLGVMGGIVGILRLMWIWVEADCYGDYAKQDAARETLILVVAFPFAVALWPLTLLAAVVFGVGWLWKAADLPRPHLPKRSRRRLSDADYIARMERDLVAAGALDVPVEEQVARATTVASDRLAHLAELERDHERRLRDLTLKLDRMKGMDR